MKGEAMTSKEMDAARAAVFDRDRALEGVGDDSELLKELARIFLEDGPRTLEKLRRAVEDGTAEQVAEAAHALKGSAGVFSAGPAVRAARALERAGRSGDLVAAPELLSVAENEVRRLVLALEALAGA